MKGRLHRSSSSRTHCVEPSSLLRRLDAERRIERPVAIVHEVRGRDHLEPQRPIAGAVDPGREPCGCGGIEERHDPHRLAGDSVLRSTRTFVISGGQNGAGWRSAGTCGEARQFAPLPGRSQRRLPMITEPEPSVFTYASRSGATIL